MGGGKGGCSHQLPEPVDAVEYREADVEALCLRKIHKTVTLEDLLGTHQNRTACNKRFYF